MLLPTYAYRSRDTPAVCFSTNKSTIKTHSKNNNKIKKRKEHEYENYF